MRIYHVSDIHLGRKRLDGRLPDQDFVHVFKFIAEAAVQDKADVFLIAGDLFDRSQVEPAHLRQAQDVLRLLKKGGIKVIAIEGNHDKAFVHSNEQTWMQFLANEELLILLRTKFNAEGAVLDPFDYDTRSGAYVDIDGIRFVGAGYLGAATPAKVRQILVRLNSNQPHVLLLHAGPEYFVGEGGGFSKDDLRAIEEKVCYLALGHIHKPMTHGTWACNPGSPENCELHEFAYGKKNGVDIPRGYAIVEIDLAQPDKPKKIEVKSNPRRPVYHIVLDCTPFGNKTKKGSEALIAAAVSEIAKVNPSSDAVIDLWLRGTLNLKRIALDQAAVAEQICALAGVLAVSLDATQLNVGTGATAGGSAVSAGIPRDQLERNAISGLIGSEHVWGLDTERENITGLFYDLKESVRTKRSTEEMAAQIAASPLVAAILASKSGSTTKQDETPDTSGETIP